MRINLRLYWWHFFLNLTQPVPLIMEGQNLRDVS